MPGMSFLPVRGVLIVVGLLALFPLATSDASAQQSETDKVKAANDAYYAALSARSIPAMESLWARTARDVNVAPPVHPTAHIGWNDIRQNYQEFWGTLDELTVSMESPTVEIHGSVAWVYGIEKAQRRDKKGQTSGGSNFGTSIFVKDGGRWRMTFHQAALMSPAH